jgi:dienelactone hydrolase
MTFPSRRDFLSSVLAAPAGVALAAPPGARADVHHQLLDLATRQQEQRRARFAAVHARAELERLQSELRQKFLGLLDGLPRGSGKPPARHCGRIEAGDYVVEKLAYESFPGYFVSALLYRPRKLDAAVPAILSPCGHSPEGKAAPDYQRLHVNLAKRGYIVLTYDPVGQGERSQFWDAARGRSRYNLACGEHAVLGNPLYLLGTSLARYRIWDGLRGLDYLASLPEVDATRLGCVGNSGGGTLTAYISALDPRVRMAVICCYITTLPRRMANRVPDDPSADPEQDPFGFVSAGLDHAGLLALRVPRPTLLGAARYDFFPIEGTRESFAEAKRLYQVAGATECIDLVEAPEKHGLTLPLRRAAYGWFDRWLAGRKDDLRTAEIPVSPRPPQELQVCPEGQVNVAFRSRPLLTVAWQEFQQRAKPRRVPLKDLLRLDPELADYHLTEVATGGGENPILVVCLNGNEAADWHEEKEFLQVLSRAPLAVYVLAPRGVGRLRPALQVEGRAYADPLDGVEENLAYNAFLVGKSLLGMRVTDVVAAVNWLVARRQPAGVVLCGRRDAALVACLAAAVEPRVQRVAVEELVLSFRALFDPRGQAVNAASLLPGLLRDFGDVSEVLAAIAPRKVLVAAPRGGGKPGLPSLVFREKRLTEEAGFLRDWVRG